MKRRLFRAPELGAEDCLPVESCKAGLCAASQAALISNAARNSQVQLERPAKCPLHLSTRTKAALGRSLGSTAAETFGTADPCSYKSVLPGPLSMLTVR